MTALIFSNGICLVLYRGATIKFTQLYRFSDGEHYLEIKEDLLNLLKLGVQIESVTSDGHKSILKSVKEVLPDAVLQRCLVRIQRDCSIWLTKHPKSFAGYDLKQITSKIHTIKSHYHPIIFGNFHLFFKDFLCYFFSIFQAKKIVP